MTPDAAARCPATGAAATQGLRTIPPRENGGNMDVKQITKGATLQLPVAVEGALFSVGDGHFAQGDGEVCVTAVEMGATAVVQVQGGQGRGQEPGAAAPASATATTSPRRSGRPPGASWPPPACRSATTA